jgi:cytoskeletal protein CcmA (bactofilin family)
MLGKSSPRKGDFSTVLHEGASIDGTFTFTGSVLLNGRMHGEIISNDMLVIGEKAHVNATIRAGSVQISGEVIGDIFAAQRVELAASARVTGNIQAPAVMIDDGAMFEGHCHMRQGLTVDQPSLTGRSGSVLPIRSVN